MDPIDKKTEIILGDNRAKTRIETRNRIGYKSYDGSAADPAPDQVIGKDIPQRLRIISRNSRCRQPDRKKGAVRRREYRVRPAAAQYRIQSGTLYSQV